MFLAFVVRPTDRPTDDAHRDDDDDDRDDDDDDGDDAAHPGDVEDDDRGAMV